MTKQTFTALALLDLDYAVQEKLFWVKNNYLNGKEIYS